MEFKTIAVHLDHTPACEGRVDAAARLARAHGSHLVGVVPTGVRIRELAPVPLDEESEGLDSEDDYLTLRAQAIAHLFSNRVRRHMPLSHEVRWVDGNGLDALVRAARASDLVILGRADHEAVGRDKHLAMTARELLDQVVMHSGRPVLFVPSTGCSDRIGERVLVAWDSSRESALAVRDALPFLRKASQVTLATLCKSTHAEQPPADDREMLDWLARHGIRATAERYMAPDEISDGLRSCAAGMAADLVVMGGYAHGPLRELLLGGVSRDMLSHARVPVLMSH